MNDDMGCGAAGQPPPQADHDWGVGPGDVLTDDACMRPPPFIFGQRTHPPAPDYEDMANWCSHPNKDSIANVLVPDDEAPAPPMENRQADCFFVCGTYYQSWNAPLQSWNAPIGDPITDEWCDVDSCLATAFNNRCRIFAPRYRQSCMAAHGPGLRANMPPELRQSSQEAVDLAYGDVQTAFEHFVEWTSDRPIIIASHSQGSIMVVRLLELFETNAKLRQRLVCAYVLGPVGSFPADRFGRCFPSLHACNGPLDTMCVVAFDHISEDNENLHSMESALAQGKQLLDDPKIDGCIERSMATNPPCLLKYPEGWESPSGRPCWCTNPLSWTSEPGRADASLYRGKAVFQTVNEAGAEEDEPWGFWKMKMEGKVQGLQTKRITRVDEGVTWAEVACDGRVLKQAGKDVCHEEWQHFYFNIRENAAQRIDAFIASR